MSGSAADATHARLADLRRLLTEKFPAAERKPGGCFPTGLADVDAAEGGLRRAVLTEFSGTGGRLFLHALLGAACRGKCFAALVDAARTFEPGDFPAAALARLLVVFCTDAMQAVKCADLLLRDGNLSLVMLDFQNAPPAQIRRIPASTWHRLQRLVEQTTAAVVVFTPEPMIEAAQLRITCAGCWTLAAQRHWRRDLLARASWRVFPRRTANAQPPAPERRHATA